MDKLSKYERIIHLHEEITEESARKIIAQIIDINEDDDSLQLDKRQPIKLYIDTMGGSAYECLSLISTIKNSQTPIHGYVNGYAFSSGFEVFISCHKRFIGKYAYLMYHQLSVGIYGTVSKLQEDTGWFKKLNNGFNNIIFENTNITKQDLELYDDRKKDWYIDAEEAIYWNCADEIY